MNRIVLIGFLLLFATCANAINDTLYINKGTKFTNGNTTAFCSFNDSINFSVYNKHIQLLQQDSLIITIFNNDTLEHTFTIDNVLNTNNTISPLSNRTFRIKFSQNATYRYYSDKSYGKLIGASGIISVVPVVDIHYYWNLFETHSSSSLPISSQSTSSFPINYSPNIFTINGFNYPNTTTDPNGYVSQDLGDTINISIINSGNMNHTLHFHGYHVKILDIKINSNQKGWIKDTFPIKKGEAMTIQLIPHQKGKYPVHNHNLIAVTNAGLYPGGMLTILEIK